ncbi:MAG: hypothetical protein ACK5WG_01800, partial [Betaproteobacteria bacterium]
IIEDTGSGLDAARVQHDPADRPAGIGLRVVRRLIAAMRGHLILEATESIGVSNGIGKLRRGPGLAPGPACGA